MHQQRKLGPVSVQIRVNPARTNVHKRERAEWNFKDLRVEHNFAKVGVVGSNPIARSKSILSVPDTWVTIRS